MNRLQHRLTRCAQVVFIEQHHKFAVVQRRQSQAVGDGSSGGGSVQSGVVPPAKFSDFVVLRITDMAQIAVYAVPSADASTGMGEPGLPPLNRASAAAGR